MFDAKTISTEQLQELPDSPVLSYVSAYLGNYTTINEQVSYVERQVEHLIPELETISNLLHVNHLVPRRLGREYGFGHFVAPYVITVGFTTEGGLGYEIDSYTSKTEHVRRGYLAPANPIHPLVTRGILTFNEVQLHGLWHVIYDSLPEERVMQRRISFMRAHETRIYYPFPIAN